MMTTPKLLRRRLLQGLGLSAGTLFLPSLSPRLLAKSSGAPCRIVFLLSHHGLVYKEWSMRPGGAPDNGAWEEPLGTLTSEQFSPILQPLQPYRENLMVLDGLDQTVIKAVRGGHWNGPIGAMTGADAVGSGADARPDLPSLDQLIAEKIALPDRFRSLELGSGGRFSSLESGQALPRISYPPFLWDRLFPAGIEDVDGTPSLQARMWAKQGSVLDTVGDEYQRLWPRLSTQDRQKLELHREMVRDLELRVEGFATLDCDPTERPQADPSISYNDRYSGCMDLLALSFACDMTRVATYSLAQMPNDAFGAPPGDVHQDFAHLADPPNSDPLAIEQMSNYGARHANHLVELIEKLQAIPEGNGSVFDNTLIVWLNEMATGYHEQDVYPMILAGGSNVPMRWGRYIKYPVTGPAPVGAWSSERPSGLPHNKVLVSIAQSMGLDVDAVGAESVPAQDGSTIDLTGPAPGVLA